MKNIFILAVIMGFMAVAIGAFGAHALEKVLTPEMHKIYETAVMYQMFHALAMLACGVLLFNFQDIKGFKTAAWLFLTGIILFSGSLYAYTLTSEKAIAIITPFGGLFFLAGWFFLILSATKIKKNL